MPASDPPKGGDSTAPVKTAPDHQTFLRKSSHKEKSKENDLFQTFLETIAFLGAAKFQGYNAYLKGSILDDFFLNHFMGPQRTFHSHLF